MTEQRGEKRIIRGRCAAKGLTESFRAYARFDGFADGNFFVLGRMQAGKLGRITNVLLHLGVLLDEDFQDALVAVNLWMLALGEQVIKLRLFFLAVAVNASVALLEREQRPRDVKVNQPMAEVVEIDTLGSDIGSDEQA